MEPLAPATKVHAVSQPVAAPGMATRPTSPDLPPSWRRRHTEARLVAGWLAQQSSFSRSASWAVGGITTLFLLIVAVSPSRSAIRDLDAVAITGLGWLSWVVGLAALGIAGRLTLPESGAVASLFDHSGVPLADRRRARLFAPFLTLGGLVLRGAAVPWLITTLVVDSFSLLGTRLLQLALVLAYSVLLTGSLTLIAHASARLWPARARTAALLFVFLPDFVRDAVGHVPSLPWALESMLSTLRQWGTP